MLADAEHDLQMWQPNLEPVHTTSAGLGTNLMPSDDVTTQSESVGPTAEPEVTSPASDATSPTHRKPAAEAQGTHLEQATAT